MALQDAIMEKMFELIEEDAKQRRNDAAHGGEHGDRGAGKLRDEVMFYKAGAAGKLPSSWARYYKQAQTVLDPEYSEYIRLKGKFE